MNLPGATEELMNQLHSIPKKHFHIRWDGVERLDWEPFETPEQAESRAKELARPGEPFAIEEHGKTCKRCSWQYRQQAS
jgi:hypothetical protein